MKANDLPPGGRAATWPGIAEVLGGGRPWAFDCGDAIDWLHALPDDALDLLVTSPPYEDARTYGLGHRMPRGQDWTDWMRAVIEAAAPKVRGVIAVNCDGKTEDYEYSGVPFLLLADVARYVPGLVPRHPIAYYRFGIPGSGGPDYLRNDWEPVLIFARPGKLPWSNNTACGQPPKWGPGGAMSNRIKNGTRVNQWGGTVGGQRKASGKRQAKGRPGHEFVKVHTKRDADGTMREQSYTPPVLANPGNVVQETYQAEAVRAEQVVTFTGRRCDIIKVKVGGGLMGHELASENEAPMPLTLAEFLVKTFAPPGGLVGDPFGGSGTTVHAAYENGRRGLACDLRMSQVQLARKRLDTVTPKLFEV